jgi:spoIIIJ-associated protein
MSLEKTTLEMIAPTVEEATAKGLEQLGLTEQDVEIEVLDQGNRGLFGLGSRQARVRLTIKNGETSSSKSENEEVTKEVEVSQTTKPLTKDQDHELQVARVVVESLLEKMKVRARVVTMFVDSTDETHPESTISIEVLGDDLSILIGRHSETLNAIQYISSLIISRELNHWVPIMIDIQGFRSRRERQLRQLAHRMAEQAMHTGRRQVLEPMPANERRIIHMELRENPDVDTESIGEEPYRKVTILPKEK